jgi:hypothetical protein
MIRPARWRVPRQGGTTFQRGNGRTAIARPTHLILLDHADEPVMCRIGAPHFARSTQQLADPDIAPLSGNTAELARGRIKTQQRPGAEIAHPDDVVLINIDPIRLRPIARQTPGSPRVLAWVETSNLTCEELADPQRALRIGPDPSSALSRHRRLDHRRRAGRGIGCAT